MSAMFGEDPRVKGRPGPITLPVLVVYTFLLRQSHRCSDLHVLVAGWEHFTSDFMRQYSVPERARSLRRMIGEGHLQHEESWEAPLDRLLYKYHKILLPYVANDGNCLLFEIVLQSPRGRLIKVWDPVNLWGKGDPLCRQEVVTILEVFFGGERDVPVYLWGEVDPVAKGSSSCSALLLMIMTYLIWGLDPGVWSENDECVIRSYVWHCLLEGRILDPPRCKLI